MTTAEILAALEEQQEVQMRNKPTSQVWLDASKEIHRLAELLTGKPQGRNRMNIGQAQEIIEKIVASHPNVTMLELARLANERGISEFVTCGIVRALVSGERLIVQHGSYTLKSMTA